jgi:hypothetical protein
MKQLQDIFRKATINGKVRGLANILLEECSPEELCPCSGLLSKSKNLITKGYPEYWRDEENRTHQTIDQSWGYRWYGEGEADQYNVYDSYPITKLEFSDNDGSNEQGWKYAKELLSVVVEKALAKTDWKKSEVWQLCSLYNLIKKDPDGVLAFEHLNKCAGCAPIIEKWADDLCDLACKVWYEGLVTADTVTTDKDGYHKFIDFDNRYTSTIPMMFQKAVLQKLGMTAYKGKKLADCIVLVTVSYEDFDEINRYGMSKAEGVGVYDAFKIKHVPACISTGSIYNTQNLRLDELDHPISKRYRGETTNIATTNETWTCDGQGQCYDPQNGKGTYTSLEVCQARCTTGKNSEIKTDIKKDTEIKSSKSTATWW